MVPKVGVEPTPLAGAVFETAASAIPPLRREGQYITPHPSAQRLNRKGNGRGIHHQDTEGTKKHKEMIFYIFRAFPPCPLRLGGEFPAHYLCAFAVQISPPLPR